MASATFEPQPLSAPLNDTALESLQALVQEKERDKKLRQRLKEAAELLTAITGDLNDQASERKVRHGKEQARRRAEDDSGEDAAAADEADAAHEEFQSKVQTLTKKMDTSIRAIIDDQTWLEELPKTLKRVMDSAHDATQTQRTNYAPSPTPAENSGNVDAEVDLEAEFDAEGDGDEGDEDGPRPSTRSTQRGIHPADTPHIQLAAALTKQSRTWNSKSLTERYAHNNDYRGWYRVLYDSKNPGESAPPMPDEGIWFAAEEGRAMLATNRHRPNTAGQGSAGEVDAGDEGSSDAELEIASERVSLKCPITLLPYVDPVTSKNCNHSYEKTAILSMLKSSPDFAPFTEAQLVEISQAPNNRERTRRENELRVREVKCPQCNISLTEADLQPNAVLKRRVARLIAQQRSRDEMATSDIDEDEEEEGDDAPDTRGTQRRPVGLGSSPAPPTDPATLRRVKGERPSSSSASVAVIPQTQLPGEESAGKPRSRPRRGAGTRRILDVEDEDEDEE